MARLALPAWGQLASMLLMTVVANAAASDPVDPGPAADGRHLPEAAEVMDRSVAGEHGRAAPAAVPAPMANPLLMPQPPPASGEALLLVEIPADSAIKYETLANGLVHVDRFLQMPVAYPANYGALPSTLAGDGDALDALVLTRAPLPPGVLLRFRPVAVLRMSDGGAPDQKLVGVPTDDIDPGWSHVRDLADLPALDRERIEAFFRVYKQLPASDAGKVSLDGWGNAAEARALLLEATARHAQPSQEPPQRR